MQSIQVGQLKSDFSSILQQVQNSGESFVIEYGKKHKKVAMLVPYEEPKGERTFGVLKADMSVPKTFDDEDEAINSMFYGHSE
jgi:antitoxin (DNA-binding transcriptional repressor) of toxin-antitoxin stability system